MSQLPHGRFRQNPGHNRPIVSEDAIDDMLTALEDRDCRAILQATSEEPLSASELSEACDLPLSTAYRKVDKLTDAGLLEEGIRLCRSGKHTSEYSLGIDQIQLHVDAEDGVSLQITPLDAADVESPGSLVAGAD